MYFRVLLTPSQSHRYLHSSVILNGMMLVFGGNTHNGTSYSNGGQCFSADFQAYDIGNEKFKPVTYKFVMFIALNIDYVPHLFII